VREASLPSFTKITECPECGAPLKITNTPARVARECSEDWRHYIVETPVPLERKHMVLVTRPKAAQPAELTVELDPVELAEREAIEAEGCGRPLTDEGLEAIEGEEELTRQALIASGWQPKQEMRE
jgi:hypothetical protein